MPNLKSSKQTQIKFIGWPSQTFPGFFHVALSLLLCSTVVEKTYGRQRTTAMKGVNFNKHLRAWPCYTLWRTTVFYDLGFFNEDTLCSLDSKLEKQEATRKDLLCVHCLKSPCPVWCEWCSVCSDNDNLTRREQEHSVPGLESYALWQGHWWGGCMAVTVRVRSR